ncbi:RNA polymerase I-specific transcription initiation factor rrn3 [Lecanosticta acicola]|uniref:RNA polymerase I-specific transcription initiation factor rrn3 n=1 Tax=Lecanosticta acicola TaxID=111012 RepID=A0AAI8Z5A1_9PEZI|nr:RNA polymerase I-specific transcription initiation factor rrn3 [Lecanosticta acicola]
MVSFAAPTSAMLPPPTPIQKRPTIGLKRNSSYLDTDDEAGLSTTTKKLKVAFDDHVDVRIMDDWNDKSFELVREEVRIGIQRHLAPNEQRDDAQYVKILQLLGQDAFSSEAPSTKLLTKYVLAIGANIKHLGECGKLVLAVLDLSWVGRDMEFVKAYTKFLLTLATAHGKYMTPIMERLVSHFERLPASTGRLPEEAIVSRTTMFDRLHTVIQTMLGYLPSAGNALLRVLTQQFPNDLATAKGYLQYQRNALRVADVAPELKAEILSLIMQRLVDIDVQIQEDLEELDIDDEDTLLQRPQRKHDEAEPEESDDSDIESISESELTTTEEEEKMRELRLKVRKMDHTQDLLFEYYEPYFKADVSPKDNEAYQDLLSQFTNRIMPSRTRHAQFLLFHFTQISPSYAEDFVQSCLRISLDRNSAQSDRLTACAYVASFTARASHVPADTVRIVFHVLSQFLERMRHSYEPNCQGPSRKKYSQYYAVVQALLYIFCFRWRDLAVGSLTPESESENMLEEDVLDEGRDLAWLPGIKEILNANIQSKLNPLKVCSAAIVAEFAKIANHLRFLYVFSILERNKRIRLGQISTSYGRARMNDVARRETAWDQKTGEAHHQLEAYFPFDPYHLPQSKRWLEGEYIEWKLPRGMKLDDEDEEEEEEEGEEEEEDASESEGEYESDDESILEDLTGQPAPDVISVSS